MDDEPYIGLPQCDFVNVNHILNNKNLTNSKKQGDSGELLIARLLKTFYDAEIIWPKDRYSPWDYKVKFGNNPRVAHIFPIGRVLTVSIKTMVRYVTRGFASFKNGPKKETIKNTLDCDLLFCIIKDPRHPKCFNDPYYAGKILLIKNHKSLAAPNDDTFIIEMPNDLSNKNIVHMGWIHPNNLCQLNALQC